MFVMADVYTVVFLVLGLLVSYPALLVVVNMLLPKVTERAAVRLGERPGRLFVLGLVVTGVLGFVIVATAEAGSGVVRAVAFGSGLVGLGLIVLGSAGIARLLGERLSGWSESTSRLKNLVRGAVAYELAGGMPIVGWFLFLPMMVVLSVGVGVSVLVRQKNRVVMEGVEEPVMRVGMGD